ncbi:hypothetical protein [uncultured Mediterranea sp.]|uniref:hypothetical protein n=1 Tax=uncultured Mediterranea sp. TaxID=1926662 RepID=UPI002589AED6|nr:hypothetical protein [uncultured Mediterranea sp.]
MKKFLYILTSTLVLTCMDVSTTMAQQIKIVYGKVLNKPEGKNKGEPFPANEKVYIFAFNTVAAARDAKKELESGNATILSDASTVAGQDGYYEIRVAENGALIFRVAMKTELREVNYNSEINMNIDGGIMLGQVTVTGARPTPKPDPEAGTIEGNNFLVDVPIPMPQQFGQPNRRLIIQPYLIDCNTEKVLQYMKPVVMDGEEFSLTQERRMSFDMKNDILSKYIDRKRALSDQAFTINIKDTVHVDDPRRMYSARCKLMLTDYTHTAFEEDYQLTTCKIRRPLQFLEFSFPDFQLDPNKYKEQPRREKRNTAGNISLTFLVGKAELDPEDPANEEQLSKLKNDLLEIVNGEGTTLKEFHITGVASPEGRYASNLALAKQRTNFAQQQISSVVPRSIMSRVYQNHQTRVATWEEVADLLLSDSLVKESEEVRAIAQKYKNPDAQYAAISKLPYYATTIKDRLPRLRTVHYEYIHEIFRELNPDEILDRYRHDPEYKSGKKQFTRYEYWHLFQMIKDPKEAEKLYLRAYNETKSYDPDPAKRKPWILAANNLAVSYLRRDTFDTSILYPLIDLTRKVNQIDRFNDGISVTETEVNPEIIVANQLAMYIRANNFSDASILARMLPDKEEFKMIKAYARCLGGYYKGGSTVQEMEERKQVFQLVKNSSPLNNVVMCMAMNSPAYNAEAMEALAQLPQTEPLTLYLKAVLSDRQNGEAGWMETALILYQVFSMEPKFIKIAINDGDIKKELLEFYEDVYGKLEP